MARVAVVEVSDLAHDPLGLLDDAERVVLAEAAWYSHLLQLWGLSTLEGAATVVVVSNRDMHPDLCHRYGRCSTAGLLRRLTLVLL